jgi:tight adherence protein C
VDVAVIAVSWFAGLGALYLVLGRLGTLRRSRERMYEADEAPRSELSAEDGGLLTRWLALAGYRGPNAASAFVAFTALSLAVGMAGAYAVHRSRLIQRAVHALGDVPGNVGDLLLPAVYLSPWLLLATLTGLPWLVVRTTRRRRVARINEDLPLFLELLATLGEAGLGFDAALERILAAQPAERPLTAEFRTFQLEVLAGRPRVACLRRLARRVDLTPFTNFISALVQTEQTGAGVAGVLRQQADDLRDRRREQATAFAMSLPVKLLFPLVICFLPGIFVATLGPTFHQFFQAADTIIRTRRGLP